MRTLVVVENLSLDGVMQAPGRPDEDERGGFPYGGWAADLLSRDPEAVQASMAGTGSTGAMLFGRRTYLDLVGFWLSTPDTNPFTELLRNTSKYVASRTLTEPLPHPNSTLLLGDAVGAVRTLKEDGEGELVVLGSGDLVRQLVPAGLVDYYQVTVLPVVLGTGTRLFGDMHTELEAVSSQAFPSGTFVARYRVVPGRAAPAS
jgi:dihydrofolate reductase